jgi:hypothetical protein
MSAYLRSNYSQRVLGKWRPFEWDRMKRRGHNPVPGWCGDNDQRRFRFERWCKRTAQAIALYYRIRLRKG